MSRGSPGLLLGCLGEGPGWGTLLAGGCGGTRSEEQGVEAGSSATQLATAFSRASFASAAPTPRDRRGFASARVVGPVRRSGITELRGQRDIWRECLRTARSVLQPVSCGWPTPDPHAQAFYREHGLVADEMDQAEVGVREIRMVRGIKHSRSSRSRRSLPKLLPWMQQSSGRTENA